MFLLDDQPAPGECVHRVPSNECRTCAAAVEGWLAIAIVLIVLSIAAPTTWLEDGPTPSPQFEHRPISSDR